MKMSLTSYLLRLSFVLSFTLLISSGYAIDQKFIYKGKPQFGYGFSSHMVLQRETNADIYGLAKPGTEVTISIGEQKLTAKANEYGRWLVQITPMEAGGPYILKLQSGTTVVELNDILIGDVWICAGQSNMRYSLNRPIDYILDGNGTYISDSTTKTLDKKVFADELEALRTQQNFPIRHAIGMGDVTLDWVLVNHENASDVKKYSPGITAVGYFYAKHLRQKLGDVPIGIIQVGNGGAAIREFLPRDVQLADSGMKKIIDSYWPDFVEKHGEEKLASYYQQMGDWLKIGQFGTPPPVESMDRTPGHLFYHGLAPLKKFSFKGFLYYQGESDSGRGYYYAHLLDKFVDVVRDTYEFSDMPFLVVLLPPAVKIGYADVVESQMYVAENKKGVHAVYAPEGAWNHPNNLHAPAKEIVGSRAALTALQKVYGGKEPYLGPRYASHKVVGNTMIITFKETGGGLVLKAGVNELTGFEIAGVDEKFISVKAKLANETDNVVLSIPENLQDGQQLHVRFQMMKYYVPVLYGKNGLPTVFFRTDEFKMRTIKLAPEGYVRGKTPDRISSNFHIYRGGLRNSATKFVNQKTGRVAFLGGSITYNPGWRDTMSAYIRNKFPNTTFEFINAGMSSMGSTSAAFRLERDVLSKGKIDLLFEEAAVNDGPDGNNVPKAEQIRAMEGIVRHSLTSNPEMDIVFMYFADPSKNTSYASNLVPDVIINHDSVAKAYNIPAINLAKEVAYRILNQEFTWESGFGSIHPNRHGQGVYSRSMKCFLDSVWKTPVQSTDTIVKKTLPINKIDLNCYDSGYLVDINKAEPSNDWILNPNWFPTDGVKTRADYTNVPMLIGQTPDAVLTFNFNGTAVGISPACGPNAGIIMSSIDNGPWMSTNFYGSGSYNLYVGRYFTLYSTLSEGDHTLRLKMAEPNIATRNSAIIRHFYVSGTKIIAGSISSKIL
jgi:sialidase-1